MSISTDISIVYGERSERWTRAEGRSGSILARDDFYGHEVIRIIDTCFIRLLRFLYDYAYVFKHVNCFDIVIRNANDKIRIKF